MPDINQIMERFRRDLELRDRIVLHLIASRYHDAAARILQDLKPLQNQIEQVRSAGGEVNRAWLLRERRLSSLYDQVRTEMNRFAELATNLTAAEKVEGAKEAVTQTLRLIGAQAPAGVSLTFNRLPNRAVEAIVGATSEGPLLDIFNEFGDATSKKVRDELIQAVVLGQGPQKTARRISDFLEGNKARALTIARTETIRAYRESGRRTALENTDVLEGWTWISALVGSCAACIALHGSKHPVEERMEAHPNCRCVQRWDTKTWQELGQQGIPETGPSTVEPGAAWFARQPEEMQLEVLGRKGLAAYKAGRVQLEDFVGKGKSEKWGKMLYQRSLKAALAAASPAPKPATFGPAGAAISPKLQIPPRAGKHLARILGLIDSLHGDGPLVDLPVIFDTRTNRGGAFYHSFAGKPVKINISRARAYATADQEFAFAHELGHYLDFTGIGGGRYATSSTSPLTTMHRFLETARKSKAIQAIEKRPRSAYRNYLLEPWEIWARAYSQYISVRTGDPSLLSGLNRWRSYDNLPGLAHWTDEDFEPIMRAIDDLLEELGWRKKH